MTEADITDRPDPSPATVAPRWTLFRIIALAFCVMPLTLEAEALMQPTFAAEFLSPMGPEATRAHWRETPARLDQDANCPTSSIRDTSSIGESGVERARCEWTAGPVRMASTLARWHVAMVQATVAPADPHQIVARLPAEGVCSLDPNAATSGHRVAVVSSREVLMACDRPYLSAEGAWCVRLRPRGVRAPWALLASAVVALAGWWTALTWRREPLRRLPWKIARRGADGHHRLTDGTVVHHTLGDATTEVLFVPAASSSSAPYRAAQGITAERACSPLAWWEQVQAADLRRCVRASAFALIASAIATLARHLP